MVCEDKDAGKGNIYPNNSLDLHDDCIKKVSELIKEIEKTFKRIADIAETINTSSKTRSKDRPKKD